jgi:hypothetical protein
MFRIPNPINELLVVAAMLVIAVLLILGGALIKLVGG